MIIFNTLRHFGQMLGSPDLLSDLLIEIDLRIQNHMDYDGGAEYNFQGTFSS